MIHQKIKTLRRSLGLTQTAFYGPIGFDKAQASIFENGRQGMPLKKLERLLEANGLRFDIVQKGNP